MAETRPQQAPPAATMGHGHSLAAWTLVAIIVLGTIVMAVAVVFPRLWLFVVGAVIALLGVVVGKVLSAMGFGVSGRPGH